jgi:hypothetical protein
MRDKNGRLDPSQYNNVSLVLASLKDKYATTPIVGDVIKQVLGDKVLTQPQQHFFQAYNQFAELYRKEATGGQRVLPAEYDQLLSAIGRPGDQNVSFADRFGSAMNESRHQFLNKVDSLMANGYRFANIDNVAARSMPFIQL